MRAKEEEKIELVVESPAEENNAAADNAQPPAVASPPQESKSENKAGKSADSADSVGSRIMRTLRMMEINQIGVLCICLVIALLSTAYILPKMQETKLDIRSWTSRLNDWDAQAATKLASAQTAQDYLNAGLQYMQGDRRRVDVAEAMICFEKSAAMGNADALFWKSQLMLYTDPSKATRETAKKLLQEASDHGSLLALELVEGNSRALRLKWNQLAQKGDLQALAAMLRLGRTEDPRYMNKIEQLAMKGDREAQYLLGYRLAWDRWPGPGGGIAYFDSVSRETDKDNTDEFFTGIKLLQQSAKNGYAPAASTLASVFSWGRPDGAQMNGRAYAWKVQEASRKESMVEWGALAAMQRYQGVANTLSNARAISPEEKNRLHVLADALAPTMVPGTADDIGSMYDHAGDEKLAFSARCRRLGTTPENLDKDIEHPERLNSEAFRDSTIWRLTEALDEGKGVAANPPLAQKLRETREAFNRKHDR